jgi:glycogen operon protein
VRVWSPAATAVVAAIDGEVDVVLERRGDEWVGDVPDGCRYGLRVEGDGRGMAPDRTLVDPRATAVWFPPGHRRDAARPGRPGDHAHAARAVADPWPDRRPIRHTGRPLVVAEMHVRGMTTRRDRIDAGTFVALADELPRLRSLGVSVVELLPVHQFDPDEGNYWGYMPLVFGATHRSYGSGPDANVELADFVSAAHAHDIEVWLDVVFNHTTEEDEHGPTYNLRALADSDYYVVREDGTYVDDAGTGNIVDATSPAAQALVMEALDRFAALGVDGFRFDLASVLSRDRGLVRSIGDWAVERGVRLVAEPWDIVRYEVGRSFPDPRWMQWNDRFRDDMRGFLRGEPGLIPAVIRRVQGSPDLFDAPATSVNFLTAHDGFTLYDLVAYDHKRNHANGWDNADGPDDNRSWNCGWEGDERVPRAVVDLRRRQIRNAWCLLLLSHGIPMFVSGDEFGRTQGGNNNAYNQDNETSWVDWARRDGFLDVERFVERLIDFRDQHPILTDDVWWGERVEWFGVDGPPDLAPHSRSVAWHLPGIYVMANMWWEALDFEIQTPGRWIRSIDTSRPDGGIGDTTEAHQHVTVAPRSIVVLTDPTVTSGVRPLM